MLISPSNFASNPLVLRPVNVLYYLPITLSNYQTVAISANTPLAIGVASVNGNVTGFPASTYSQYEAPNLANIEFFFANGTIIPSWLEGNTLNEIAANGIAISPNSQNALINSGNVLWWVTYPWNTAFLPAGSASTPSTNTIYMGFVGNLIATGPEAASNTIFGQKIGEAAQLSCDSGAGAMSGCSTYGKYDNGNTIFSFEANFIGSSTSNLPGWIHTSSVGSFTLGVANSLTLGGSAQQANTLVYSTISFPQNVITEALQANFVGGQNNAPRYVIGESTSQTVLLTYLLENSYYTMFAPTYVYGYLSVINYVQTTASTITQLGTNGSGFNTGAQRDIASFVWISNENQKRYDNYAQTQNSVSAIVAAGNVYPFLASYMILSVSATNSITYQWWRTRIAPPNSILPATTYGPVSAALIVSNTVAYQGQSEFINYTVNANTIGPYTYNFYITNSINGNIIYNSLVQNALTFNSVSFSLPATSNDLGSLYVIATYTDVGSNTATVTSTISAYRSFSNVAITPSSTTTLDIAPFTSSSQSIALTASVSGGIPPYTYNFLIFNSITNVPINSILFTNVGSNSLSYTYTPSIYNLGNTLEANVIITDSAPTPSSGNSIQSGLIKMNRVLNAPYCPTLLNTTVASPATLDTSNMGNLYGYGNTTGQWQASDSWGTVPLPNGNILIISADTWFGSSNGKGSGTNTVAIGARYIHNSLLNLKFPIPTNTATSITTLYGGSYATPNAFFASASPPGSLYGIVGGGIMGPNNNEMYIPLFKWPVDEINAPILGYFIANVLYPSMTVASIEQAPSFFNGTGTANDVWGSSSQASDGYTYIYGANQISFFSEYNYYVARVLTSVNTIYDVGNWMYWTGSAWSSSDVNLGIIGSGWSNAPPTIQYFDGVYVMINSSQQGYSFLSPVGANVIKLQFGCSPVGPFPYNTVTTPTVFAPNSVTGIYGYSGDPTVVSYGAFGMPSLNNQTMLKIEYDLNSNNEKTNTYSYRVHFLNVTLNVNAPGIVLSASNSPTIGAGQYITFNAWALNGTAPYTFNFLVFNSVTNAIIANDLLVGSQSPSNSFIWHIPTADGNNAISANVFITDSASTPITVNSVNIPSITVNAQISATITISNTLLDYGQYVSIIPAVSGGQPSYVANYIIANSVTNKPINSMLVTSANPPSELFYLPSTIAGNSLEANIVVTDSATTNQVISSPYSYLGFNSLPNIPTITITNSLLDAGQYSTITATVSGGTLPYSANFVISNTVTGNPINSILITSSNPSGTVFIPSYVAGNTVQANVVVNDSATTNAVANSVYTAFAFNAALSIVSLASSNGVATSSEWETINAIWSGGVSTYTVNFIVTNSVNGNIISNSLQSGLALTSASFMFHLSATSNDLGTLNANVIVTDSASTNAIVKSTNTIIVSTSAFAVLTLTSNNINYGLVDDITSSPAPSTDTANIVFNGVQVASGTGSQTYTICATPQTLSGCLAPGSYSVYGCDSSADVCSATNTIVINKAPPTGLLSISSSNSITYPNTALFNGIPNSVVSNQITWTLYDSNNNLIGTSTNTLAYSTSTGQLAVGVYLYTYNTIGDGNYLSGSITNVITITKAAPVLSLQETNATYPNLATLLPTISDQFSQLTGNLFDSNNNFVASTVSSTTYQAGLLGVGSYIYTFNTLGNGNYLSGSVSNTVTILQQPTTTTLAPCGGGVCGSGGSGVSTASTIPPTTTLQTTTIQSTTIHQNLTTSPTTSQTTTIPTTHQNSSSVSVSSNASIINPIVIYLNNSGIKVTAYPSTQYNGSTSVNVRNIQNQVQPPNSLNVLSAISITASINSNLAMVMDYPCSMSLHDPEPYQLSNGSWVKIAQYTRNSSACDIAFTLQTSSAEVAIFAQSAAIQPNYFVYGIVATAAIILIYLVMTRRRKKSNSGMQSK